MPQESEPTSTSGLWDPWLYAGSAPYYAQGRVTYPAELAHVLVAALPLDGSGRLVDVGCGPGSLTLLLAPQVAEAVGVDADEPMLAEARRIAAGRHITNVTWRHLRAEDLPAGLGHARAVTLAQAFHWMDRPRVAAAARRMLAPHGALVHVHATTHRGGTPGAGLAHPLPPRTEIEALVRRFLGARRRAGQGFLPDGTPSGEDGIYRAAGFTGPQRLQVPGRVVTRTSGEVAASVFSVSGSAPHLFGDRLAAFDADLRDLLVAAAGPDGVFSEQMGPAWPTSGAEQESRAGTRAVQDCSAPSAGSEHVLSPAEDRSQRVPCPPLTRRVHPGAGGQDGGMTAGDVTAGGVTAGGVAGPGHFALRAGGGRSPLVDRLGRRLPRVGLAGVMADLDRAAEVCEVPGKAAGEGFTWEPRDRDDASWWPQGVASTDGGRVLLVSWYAKRGRFRRNQGSRVTVVDRTDPARPRYRHVLLVGVRRRLRLLSLGSVRVHAGGIAVRGDLLYVADTFAGVRVFRLGDVTHVPRRRLDALLPWARAGTRTLGRRPTGGFTSYGYGYVLPESGRLQADPGAAGARLRYSFLSLGDVEGRLCLVVGEYRRAGTAPRLVRYPLDPGTGLPAFTGDGRCRPLDVHEDQPPRMQGVAVDGSTWFVTASAGEGNPGDLYVGAPGAFRRHRGVLPTGPEDLDWSRPGEELWCVTEWPGRRWVFPIETSRWSGPG